MNRNVEGTIARLINTVPIKVVLITDGYALHFSWHRRNFCRRFEATEARILRVVLSGFYDMALVIARAFLEFDGEDIDKGGRSGATTTLST